LRQLLGWVDPMADAMRGGRAGLRRIFADIPALTEASVPDLATRAARGAVKDLLLGKRLDAAKDAALLIGRARATYGAYRETRIPQLEAIQHDPTAKAIPERHGFCSWLQSPDVCPVLQAAGRRLGLAEDCRTRLRGLLETSAPDLTHGFWYGLYSTAVFQLLVLEGLYAWSRPRPLFWAARVLILCNLTKVVLLLHDAARFWSVRVEAAAIAAAIGIPDLGRFAFRLLAGQAFGVVSMFLLLVRFLALGEALHQPGPMLSGLHQMLVWIQGFYLEMARIIF